MTTWSILLDGKTYSAFVSRLRSAKHADAIVKQWKDYSTSIGYDIPKGELTAIPRRR